MVLNVGKFKFSHPGGKFSIDYNIGRDVSKFFYGGYALEITSGMRPHTHTNIARQIVNSLIIGKLEDKAKVFSVKIVDVSDVTSACSTFTL